MTEDQASFGLTSESLSQTHRESSDILSRSSVPSDFSYKHDAKHSSTIVVARLAEATGDVEFLSKLEDAVTLKNAGKSAHSFANEPTIDDPASAHHSISLRVLRPFFFGLHNQRRLESVHNRLLQMLQKPSEDFSAKISVPVLVAALTDDIRRNFRKSLAMHLFGWPEISSLRMRLSLADFVWVSIHSRVPWSMEDTDVVLVRNSRLLMLGELSVEKSLKGF
jgi:hypothetical protein